MTKTRSKLPNDNVLKPNFIDAGMADRAQVALQHARLLGRHMGGGPSRNTLGRITKGLPVKRSTLFRFAAVCGVNPTWLLLGNGDMVETAPGNLGKIDANQAPETPPTASQPSSAATPESRIDIHRLGAAMRIAGRDHATPLTAADWIAAARDAVAIYELLGDHAGDLAFSDAPVRPS